MHHALAGRAESLDQTRNIPVETAAGAMETLLTGRAQLPVPHNWARSLTSLAGPIQSPSNANGGPDGGAWARCRPR